MRCFGRLSPMKDKMKKSTRVNKVQRAALLLALYGILRIKRFKKTACLSTEKSFS